MKRRLSLLSVLLAVFLLCGCISSSGSTFTRDGLSMTLPSYFQDKSADSYANNLNFLYSYGSMGFLGIREKRSDFPAGYENMGLEAYAKFVILGNGLTCQLMERDGFYTFSYTAQSAEGELTYVAIVLEDQDAYWTVQGYCLSQYYEENQALLWKYLITAKVN